LACTMTKLIHCAHHVVPFKIIVSFVYLFVLRKLILYRAWIDLPKLQRYHVKHSFNIPDCFSRRRNSTERQKMCLFTTKKEDRYVRNWDDPAPHRSYYSAHPDSRNAVQARLPEESFDSRRRSHSRRRRSDYEFVDERPRRSREYIEYDRREYDSRREVDYVPRRELEYPRPRSSRGSVGLPAGYMREVRPRH
jgi:hypothetical protein